MYFDVFECCPKIAINAINNIEIVNINKLFGFSFYPKVIPFYTCV